MRWGILSTAQISAKFIEALLLPPPPPQAAAMPRAEDDAIDQVQATTTRSQLVAVASRDRGRIPAFLEKNFPGVQFDPPLLLYGSYEELLADRNVEAVYIPLPNTLHATYVEKCIRAGKHVLVEKPAVLHPDDGERLLALAQDANVCIAENMGFLYLTHVVDGGASSTSSASSSVIRTIQQLIEDNGGATRITSSYTHPLESRLIAPSPPSTTASSSAAIVVSGPPPSCIAFDKNLGGGALTGLGCYCIALIGSLLPEFYNIQNVDGKSSSTATEKQQSDDCCGSMMRECDMPLNPKYDVDTRCSATFDVECPSSSSSSPPRRHRVSCSVEASIEATAPKKQTLDICCENGRLRVEGGIFHAGKDGVLDLVVVVEEQEVRRLRLKLNEPSSFAAALWDFERSVAQRHVVATGTLNDRWRRSIQQSRVQWAMMKQ